MTTISHSPEETQAIARSLAQTLRGGECLVLYGDLGAGKTTFTQGLVAALGSSARVKSPTFTVMNEYPVTNHPTIRRVAHCDLYRFTRPEELGALELDEYRTQDTVLIAEWPNAIAGLDWHADIVVTLSHNSDRTRTITVES